MYYLYQHSTFGGKIFYIGKGTKNSIVYGYNGYKRAHIKSRRTKKWKEYATEGFRVDIIEESNDEYYIKNKELKLIENCKECINFIKKPLDIEYFLHTVGNSAFIKTNKYTYYLDENDKFFNLDTKKEIKIKIGNGYKSIRLLNKKCLLLHRIKAQCFIPNPLNLPVVNHIDGNKLNNKLNNLEWTTQQQNIIHGIITKKRSYKSKPVLQINKEGEIIKEWDSYKEIESKFKITLLRRLTNTNPKTIFTMNFFWIYKKDYIKNDNKRLKIFKEIVNMKKYTYD